MTAPKAANDLTVYVAGPMTGIPAHNVPAFDRAAAEIRARGWTAVTPPDITRSLADRLEGVHADGSIDDAAYRFLVREDIRALLGCDTVALLPGWRKSKGARLEYLVAVQLGFPIYTLAGLLSLGGKEIGSGHLLVTCTTERDDDQ